MMATEIDGRCPRQPRYARRRGVGCEPARTQPIPSLVVSASFDPTTVEVCPAATVMLVRDLDDAEDPGIEVFMLRRTTKTSFAAGMYVFPGGRVDGADGADEIAPFCEGLDDADASAQLNLDSGGLAYWVASVRECFEEAGLLLAERRDGMPLDLHDHDRHAIHDGTMSMAELCHRDDLVLNLSTTHYVAHWVTPFGERRRFDTRFFLAEAPPNQEGLHDDKETIDSLWVQPSEALRMHADRELMMLPPTIASLKFLEPHRTSADAVAAGEAAGPPPRILPKIKFSPEGKMIGIAMPWDPGYDELPEGPRASS